MIVKKRDQYSTLTLDLTGPQGNAFVLLGYAAELAKKFNLDADVILEEMQSGDYENLVEVFDQYFGEFVVLLR
jgi:hypothetical protein